MTHSEEHVPVALANPLDDQPAYEGHSASPKSPTVPVRVLFLIDHLGGLGGGETSLVRIVRMLPKDRVECCVVTLDHRVNPHLAQQITSPLHVFPLQNVLGGESFRVAARIRRLMRSEKIDIVHTFFESSNLWGGLVTKFCGGPLLVSSRRDMNILRTRVKQRLAYRLVNRICDRVLTVSDAVRDLCIREEHFAPERVVTLYNGVELDVISDVAPDTTLQERYGFSACDPIITSVANVRRVKGLDTLVQAAAIVCREFPQARFLIVGGENEADYGRELRQQIEMAGLRRNIVFHGLTSEVIPILKASKIFCLLSRSEGFSSAVLEAMACALPCVVSRAGGNPEAVIDGTTGYVVPPENPEACADRILELLRNPWRRAEMGDAGYHLLASRFTARKMVSDLATFYEQLLEEHRQCPMV